jgi:hypothetical protein
MPTVLLPASYRFFFYSRENAEPPHIHVESGDKVAKYWLQPVKMASSKRFGAHELTEVRALVDEHSSEFLKAWHDHFDAQ